ncbi:2-amino-4-hydroxy-6-hydroxymethyldihydropteridine diphosphokinase [Mucilaginibacter sp. L3T2-6]|uniref:2-amino-4-hydroxy-6- hydroxymethyldihydropteridine diphosphokinase n=1 Tax=Mucilaginibacter sp. L3T2-6 TaxID=3062491 RepID=UPI0026775A76|nr:2-amino-4-hydroxy-6-hydroxymethyldihydropteridine diphosphokinase [Mucilaginibacter sp. L3T2-6]MDO3642753.1 2-amino-4-hydroxy-6-hydroxymethyldihydropteridine diphosphokinase [Mucilaginibacter sp. L3T2-6]MDV6215402.1 2-amino-4-hydroxy-6-hydroxymethyldihydropteridine diphosphokinase [Mucilaginibacter sp. L3T2-6]
MKSVFLLLGSNLGDRQYFLRQAIALIDTRVAKVIKTSSIYETQSWGKSDAPDYLNQVIVLETEATAQEVLDKILNIELMLGRKREEKWGSRTIDIDILFYGDEIINEEGLHIPHPELHNRRFTLEPLKEIAPDLRHPVFGKTITAIKNELKDNLIVKKL